MLSMLCISFFLQFVYALIYVLHGAATGWSEYSLSLNEENLEEIKWFRYLGMDKATNRTLGVEGNLRMTEDRKDILYIGECVERGFNVFEGSGSL